MKMIHYPQLVGLLCLFPLSCNQADPVMDMAGSDATGETTDQPPTMLEGNYFPLQDGASWTYRHQSSDGTTWDEIVSMRAATYNGAPAFEMEDNAGANGENTISTLVEKNGQVMRVHKEVELAGTPVMSVDYDPGFLRFDKGWAAGERVNWMYDRVEYDAMGTITSEDIRHQIFEVTSLSTSVTVAAGTFDCIEFTRTRADTGDQTRFWFAPDVGKVKHQSLPSGAIEELTEYSVP